MKTITGSVFVVALVVALSPGFARAEAAPASAPAEARPPASWSLGGGVTFGSLGYVGMASSSSLLGLQSLQLVEVPGATGTLERRVSERSWLTFDVRAGLARRRADVPAGSYGYARDDSRLVSASLGLRRPVTGRGAPVEVSALVAVHGGLVDGERHVVSSSTETRQDPTTWFAGARVGIVVQRELTDGLALRVSTPLLVGTYSRGRVREFAQPTRTWTDLSIAMSIVPRLELVAFF